MRPIVAIWLAAVVALVGLLGWDNARDETACRTKAGVIGASWHYTYLGGCQIEMQGRWIDADRLFVNPDGSVMELVSTNTPA